MGPDQLIFGMAFFIVFVSFIGDNADIFVDSSQLAFAIWIRVLVYELAMDVLLMTSHPAILFDYVLLSSGRTAGDG